MQTTLLVLLALGGLFFSVVSILENHVKWILSFCEIFGEGCRKALKFHLFGIPVSWYGMGYYIILIFLVYFWEPWVFWYIMAGFGIELTFIWIMIYIRAFCIFCVINAAMMTGLFLYVFDVDRVWESISIILVCFAGSLYFLYRENVDEFSIGVKKKEDSITTGANGGGINLKNIPVQDDPGLGPRDASVVVIEFSDYLCPGCRKAHKVVEPIKEKYKDRILWVYKDLPVNQQKDSHKMAEAAHCADDQDQFWQYQDLLFSSETELKSETMEKFANQLGLDEKKFKNCVDNRKYQSKVEKNATIAKKLGIFAVPAFVINGQLIKGVPSPEKLEELIEKALKEVSSG